MLINAPFNAVTGEVSKPTGWLINFNVPKLVSGVKRVISKKAC